MLPCLCLLLLFPKVDTPTRLTTDASDAEFGAVLLQHHNGTRHPISFLSNKITPAETRYSTFNRELLAVHLPIKHFVQITDHSPSYSTRTPIVSHPDKFVSLNTFFNSPPLSSISRELIMWLLTLIRVCILMLCYLENHPLWTSRLWPTFKLDPQIRSLQSSVPLAWRRIVLDSLHGLSHPGILATRNLVAARFVWPGINADVRQWTRACFPPFAARKGR